MEKGNTQIVLNNKKIDFLTGKLTQFAQVARALRRYDDAERLETIRNTINAQFHAAD